MPHDVADRISDLAYADIAALIRMFPEVRSNPGLLPAPFKRIVLDAIDGYPTVCPRLNVIAQICGGAGHE